MIDLFCVCSSLMLRYTHFKKLLLNWSCFKNQFLYVQLELASTDEQLDKANKRNTSLIKVLQMFRFFTVFSWILHL